MEELRIDPEFQNKIPPLTDAEFEQLRENILSAGEVYEPLVTWKGVIVDGHNRWKVIQEHPELPWRSREMDFADKWAAFDWMYKNQLGRRNLTEAQRAYLIGKCYEARKRSHGAEQGGRGNQYTGAVSVQNANLPNGSRTPRTNEILGKELGVDPSTITRSEHYAHGIDAIRESDPETADAILKGELKPKKVDVAMIGKAKKTSRTEMIDRIKKGERITETCAPEKIGIDIKDHYTGGGTMEYRQRRDRIAASVADLYNTDSSMDYTVSDMMREIEMNANTFVCVIRNIILDHEELATEHRHEIKECVNHMFDKIIEIIGGETDD